MADILEQDFASAARYLTSRNDLNLSNETQLEFYALYKTVTVGHCKSERPGYFDFKARAKWDAWAAMSGLSKSAAMKQYIKLAGKAGWTRSAVNLHEESGKRDPIPEKHMSMAVSTLENTRDSVEDAEKSVWHWAEEGQTDKVLTLIDSGEASIECKDEQGMTLLHWAADRGYEDLMRGLLSRTANVDVQDSSGQTPLHLGKVCFT
ncbi:acyl CoA binding protein-domain-containing protein [Powellomyces hirtus]|nr:acyl CoA binding protein-domain-containing protein [Powellomyces hirtus]